MAIYQNPGPWDGTPMACGQKGDVRLFIQGTPSTPYTVQVSPDGVNWFAADVISLAGNPVTGGILSVAGTYFMPGGVWYQTIAGAGSTLFLSATA